MPGEGQAWLGVLTSDCFKVFGVQPALGRGFSPSETPFAGDGSPVAVISHTFWQRAFGGSPDVLGRTLVVDSTTTTVVGVMPAGFTGWSKDTVTDVWVPFNAHRTATGSADFIGRLHPGASAESLRPHVEAIWPTLMETVWPEGPVRTPATRATRSPATFTLASDGTFDSGAAVRRAGTHHGRPRGAAASTRVLSLRLAATAGDQAGFDQAVHYPALVERLAALPGVEAVGFARLFGTINARLTLQPVVFAGETEGSAGGVMEYISPGFFDTVGVPLLTGRDVTWRDLPDTPRVAIVSESLARTLEPNGDVVGRHVRYGADAAAPPMEIVGVVGDVSLGNYRETAVPLLYVPAIQLGEARFLTVHLRTSGPPLALAPAASEVVASSGREQVGLAATLDFLFTNSIVAERMASAVSSASAALALALSSLGLYALLAHAVTRRTREMGIRMAVGASAAQVARLVMGEGVRLVAAGLVIGAPLGMGLARWVQALLYGVTTTDRTALVVAAALLLATSVVASALPARRAAKIDPAQALRAD